MQEQIHDNHIMQTMLQVIACNGNDWLELTVKQRRLVTDSQPNHVKNFMYIHNNVCEKIYMNTDITKLANCTRGYENEFT
jgi:hypothetical protein